MIDPKIAVEAGEARDEYIQKHAQAVAERDAAIAERDRLLRASQLAYSGVKAERDAAREERDRLRTELEALREWADSVAEEQWPDTTAESLVERLDAILRGVS